MLQPRNHSRSVLKPSPTLQAAAGGGGGKGPLARGQATLRRSAEGNMAGGGREETRVSRRLTGAVRGRGCPAASRGLWGEAGVPQPHGGRREKAAEGAALATPARAGRRGGAPPPPPRRPLGRGGSGGAALPRACPPPRSRRASSSAPQPPGMGVRSGGRRRQRVPGGAAGCVEAAVPGGRPLGAGPVWAPAPRQQGWGRCWGVRRPGKGESARVRQ